MECGCLMSIEGCYTLSCRLLLCSSLSLAAQLMFAETLQPHFTFSTSLGSTLSGCNILQHVLFPDTAFQGIYGRDGTTGTNWLHGHMRPV